MKPFLRCLAIVLISALSPFTAPRAVAAEKLDFNRDIRPLLSDKCFACHGPDAKQAATELRLDLATFATKPDEEGRAAIVPGDPDASQLVRRVNATDPDERMPPEDSNKKLSSEEKERLIRWIREGAEYQQHWAFIGPVEPAVPGVQGSGFRVQNSIDAFVAARLQQEGLTQSPEADKATLIRRLSFDLTGLPPTSAEVDAFINDSSDTAYEQVVDRLLASPHYGERMAMWWLDGARYADSNGYHTDDARHMWHWRDGVINAFNTNQPFDQFTIEQLAGDMLPGATVAQRIASGFNRNHRMNSEGGIIPEEWRIEGVIDRVETVSAVWMALTLGCARCHDHKYDPITQREFYQVFSFFNNVPETGKADPYRNTSPVMQVQRPGDEQKLADLNAAIAAAEHHLQDAEAKLTELQTEWEQKHGRQTLEAASAWQVLAPHATSAGGATFVAQQDGSYLVSGTKPLQDVYTLVTPLASGTTLTALQFDILPDETGAGQSFGRVGNGNIALSEFEVEIIDAAQLNAPPTPIKLAAAAADYSQSNWLISYAIDGNRDTGWAVDGNDPSKRVERHGVFLLDRPISLPQGGTLTVRVRQETFDNHTIGRFRLSMSSRQEVKEPYLRPPALVLQALSVETDRRSAAEREALSEFYRSTSSDGRFAEAKTALLAARTARDEFNETIPTVMVMEEMPQPRDCFVLTRGQYDKPGEKVSAGLPVALPPMPSGQPMNRLGLARWLVHPTHPLTARVQVNRYWELLFGTGLVKSSDNFGVQAEFPSHPELLDWLATEYIRLGWDTKAILKTIVTSATYRQSSRAAPQLIDRDPDNRLLARGPRFRLQAELVRDNALAIAGLLVDKIGGAPVRPYQPEGIWNELTVNGNLRDYRQDEGEGLYRRSLYTIWKRTSAPPNLLIFDMPSRESCVVRRSRTNTPLQALSLLNEMTYVEAARKLAERTLQAGGVTPAERIAFAFYRATARRPREREQQILVAALQRNLERFRALPTTASELLAIGKSPSDPSLDPIELAAYTMTASVILNLDETITKE
jgi:hypothetical protein